MALPGALEALCLQPKSSTFQASLRKSSLPRNSTLTRWPFSKLMAASVKCSGSSSDQPNTGRSSGGGGLKNALSNIVDKRVEELLGRDENKDLLDKLNKASERVQLAREELAEIQRQELEALQMREYINQLEAKASEIAECQKEVSEAGTILEEAQRSLAMSSEGSVDNRREEERSESVKAAVISAVVGTLAAAPIYLSKLPLSPQLLLQLGITFASCALFGVTFRYAVRRDLDNVQLKTGTVSAFAFVKGLAILSGAWPLELNSASFLSHALDGAFFVSQDLLVFAFAAVSLDFCFKSRVVSPFPIERTD